MDEIWKDIKGYEGLYQVSNLGRVRNIKYRRLLKYGYVGEYNRVTLYSDSKPDYRMVHRLVAESFIDNPNNYPIVNHKDENKSNNVVSNLEWCTMAYNLNYGNCQIKKSLSMIGKNVGKRRNKKGSI